MRRDSSYSSGGKTEDSLGRACVGPPRDDATAHRTWDHGRRSSSSSSSLPYLFVWQVSVVWSAPSFYPLLNHVHSPAVCRAPRIHQKIYIGQDVGFARRSPPLPPLPPFRPLPPPPRTPVPQQRLVAQRQNIRQRAEWTWVRLPVVDTLLNGGTRPKTGVSVRSGRNTACPKSGKPPLYLTLPYVNHHCTLPYLTLPYLTLPYLTLPYLTLPYLTLPYLTLPYLTLP